MPITTFLSETQKELYSRVSDKDLDKLFQEVRKTFNDRYFLWEKEVLVKRYFRRSKCIKLYVLYYNYSGGSEVQEINFQQESGWSINTMITRSYITTYFYGLLNGTSNHFNPLYDLRGFHEWMVKNDIVFGRKGYTDKENMVYSFDDIFKKFRATRSI